jgi:hypothetical protein
MRTGASPEAAQETRCRGLHLGERDASWNTLGLVITGFQGLEAFLCDQ